MGGQSQPEPRVRVTELDEVPFLNDALDMALWLVESTKTFREPPSKSGWVSLQTATKRASQASRRP